MRTVFELPDIESATLAAREHAAMAHDAPEGWSAYSGDPARIVNAFGSIAVRDEFKLIAYQYRSGGNGNGVVWALPRWADTPLPSECPVEERHWLQAPRPTEALDDYRATFVGDGSAWSYLASSLSTRELGELGAVWHGEYWSTHELLDADPRVPSRRRRRSSHSQLSDVAALEWAIPALDEWKPHVDIDGTDAIVRFVTCTALGMQQIILHEDRYVVGDYRFKTTRTDVAKGGGGYYF